ncbi:MAG: hypothetical protein A3F12_07760 [Gammaproteobacteria bacterium RIFCSPHIGHO2_12_FULL_38_14]|nr:MAG: hypothetical protein A3F12_07760 [Gammaproteobacteria bacterium RIFCSPHIGHO2_12_FULL_38_14]
MLIEFHVTNYRSIRDTQTLSMVASTDNAHLEASCVETAILAVPKVLRSAILYGPNASGKSNLISALGFMRSMVETSAVAVREGQSLNVTSFRFDSITSNAPSEFEVTFLENGVRYQYGFSLTSTRVTREWLLVYVERKAQRWFEREYDEKQDQYNWYFGSHLTGGNQRQVWKDSTRSNALFLSTAVNLNSDQLRPIFNWFVNKLIVISGNQLFSELLTMSRVTDSVFKSQLIQFLRAADLGITDVMPEMKKGRKFNVHLGTEPAVENQEVDIPSATFLHQGKDKAIAFEFKDQSHGTQRLFSYAAPVLDALENGKTLVVDELDSSLHAKMVRFLVNLMHDVELNKNNAQLIFTSHNTSLLDTDLFRRDQIWFIEKDNESASQLYPLTDFSPRKGEALEKGYLIGRYGALPFFGEFKL